MKPTIAHVLVISDDFKQTVDTILMESEDTQEKFIILQTLLSIASKSEQSKAKLKNSSICRKLKDQLAIMQSDSELPQDRSKVNILNLTSMLSRLLNNEE